MSKTMFYYGHHLVCVNEHNIHEHLVRKNKIEWSCSKRNYVKISHKLNKYAQSDRIKKRIETYEKSYEIMSNDIHNSLTIYKQWSHLGHPNFQ
jgi:hypothetical protein